MPEHEGEFIDIMDLAGLTMGTTYQVADTLLAAIVHAETLDRTTWITRQGKVVAAIAPADYVNNRTEPQPTMTEKLDEILGIIRREELCGRCGLVPEGYARGAEGQRLCHSDTRDCYKQYLWDEMHDRLGPELRADLGRQQKMIKEQREDHDEQQADDQGKDHHRT